MHQASSRWGLQRRSFRFSASSGVALVALLAIIVLVTARDQASSSPPGISDLFDAIDVNNVGRVKAILAAGVSPDACGSEGYSVLMYAAMRGHVSCVEALLNAGADPNLAGQHRARAIDISLATENHDITRLLMQHGGRQATPTSSPACDSAECRSQPNGDESASESR